MSRYRRLVPAYQRSLIKRFRLPKPNWYVGSAEARIDPEQPLDAALLAEVREVCRRIDAATSQPEPQGEGSNQENPS